MCGSGANAFDIWDQGTVEQIATRYYDADGNLTLRRVHEFWRPGGFSNPPTGAAVPYRQTTNIADVLAVPGDESGEARRPRASPPGQPRR